MDLGAYAQIEDLEPVMTNNNIDVPRLRGLRLMENEKPLTEKEIKDLINYRALLSCENFCQSDFVSLDPNGFELSGRTDRIIKKYLFCRDGETVDVKWKSVHGRKRKMFRYAFKKADKRVRAQYDVWNKYCGRDDVLYIHARIGGRNWNYYGGPELEKQPWFIEKVDDYFDDTYCDIYAKIENTSVEFGEMPEMIEDGE